MEIAFVLLHVSTLLTLILLVLLWRIKNKKPLHKYFNLAILDIFLWCLVSLIQQYIGKSDDITISILISNLIDSFIGFLSFLLFFIGYAYSKSGYEINKKLNLLFLIPVISAILIWTNEFHHLVYIVYSNVNSERVRGFVAYAITIVDYAFVIVGLYYLLRFSIKNSGFFSKQSFLIVIGALIPILVNLVYFINLVTFPSYFQAIAFSMTVVCLFIAMLRFDLFTIVPVALQTVVDHISDSYIVLSDTTIITDFNKTFVDTFKSVYSAKRKEPLEDLLVILKDEDDSINTNLAKSIAEKKTLNFEVHINVPDKNFDKYFIIEITPIVSNAQIICTIILFKDVTEQKKDAELIAKTQYMLIESEHLASLGQLVGGIAHNLKTPIMSIAGGLEGLSDLINEYDESVDDADVTPDDHREIAEEMRTWIGKMREYTAYMSDIISTVKGQAAQLTASMTDSFSIKELIKRVDILMNHELKRFSCQLNVQCSIDKRTKVKGEINSFIQVINNLITNSIEAYEGKEGLIEFSISREESQIRFEIKDTASGMPEDVKDRLFKEMITTKAKNGTGLGLYISYSTITGRFGGEMWFESVHGMGTTFYIMIPAA